jgi:hypothetical protein
MGDDDNNYDDDIFFDECDDDIDYKYSFYFLFLR